MGIIMGEVVEFPADKIRRAIVTTARSIEDNPKLDAPRVEVIGCATVVYDSQPSNEIEPA